MLYCPEAMFNISHSPLPPELQLSFKLTLNSQFLLNASFLPSSHPKHKRAIRTLWVTTWTLIWQTDFKSLLPLLSLGLAISQPLPPAPMILNRLNWLRFWIFLHNLHFMYFIQLYKQYLYCYIKLIQQLFFFCLFSFGIQRNWETWEIENTFRCGVLGTWETKSSHNSEKLRSSQPDS